MKTLKNFIESYYYQTVWDDFDDDICILNTFIKDSNQVNLNELFNDCCLLLKREKEVVFDYLNSINECGGLYFETKEESYEWLLGLKESLEKING